ncbi:MAG: hypothetical protein A2920_02340 [Candidatus Zambryskibacteria bacterium RIFCSPLOWO2_01_FULL_43_17]|uniref:General secretion pathway GspH domain-containing protein n=1 Tax=Candidatus Zambryskibacteria bacterium RIFCSPLOWO2_01_FULL_43_17 TaxID=1802760 RepID=A0A1G2U0Z1_9BACT|nr:MAG: hypothetical protein A2920_02340 [Candidatus Zambryskibacteria bacterium RIFCSPLOWO2_01_FULL_43_17]
MTTLPTTYSRQPRTMPEAGVTLIEPLVSIAVFSVIMAISLGSVLSILDAGRKANSLRSVMTNLNFALEILSREIKFGTNYYCGTNTASPHTLTNDCAGGATSITFTSSTGVDTIYRLQNNQIQKSTDHGVSYSGITSPDIIVQDLKFYVFGSTAGNTFQPRAFITTRGYAGVKPTAQSKFFIQTSASQRILDI